MKDKTAKDTNDIIARVRERTAKWVALELDHQEYAELIGNDVLALATQLSRYAELEGAAKEYRREMEEPFRDVTMCQQRRAALFAALASLTEVTE